MTLTHVLLIVLVFGILFLAVLLVKKVRDLRAAPEEADDQLSRQVQELLQDSVKKDAPAGQGNKLDFDE